MNFQGLQESLRRATADRIRQREFTGWHLANETGFTQAHISNFLTRRRGLRLEGMDRILKFMQLTVADLLDPADIEAKAYVASPSEGYENIPLVKTTAAHGRHIPHSAILEYIEFRKVFLRRLRPDTASSRADWIRFLCIKADAENGSAMAPFISLGAILLIDRHYNSLDPYRPKYSNLYAVQSAGRVLIRYIEPQDGTLLLRPQNQEFPLTVIVAGRNGNSLADQIIGRICHASREL